MGAYTSGYEVLSYWADRGRERELKYILARISHPLSRTTLVELPQYERAEIALLLSLNTYESQKMPLKKIKNLGNLYNPTPVQWRL